MATPALLLAVSVPAMPVQDTVTVQLPVKAVPSYAYNSTVMK